MFDVNPQCFMRLTQNDTANLAVVLDNVPSGGTFSPTSTLTIRKDFGLHVVLWLNTTISGPLTAPLTAGP